MERLKLLISWLLIMAGAVEAVWGLLQVYGYELSNHSLYALTGSFYNPGPYSGFLAMCLPLALHEWLKGKRVWKHLALAALVLIVGKAVCGTSEGFPERETGMGCKDGAVEKSQGGIDRHPADEGGSGGVVGSDEGLSRARINNKVRMDVRCKKHDENMLGNIF